MPQRYQFVIGLRVYVASSLTNAENVRILHERLKAEGHSITYDWTTHGRAHDPEESDAWNVQAMERVADAELEGVRSADVFVALLPGGRGTHVEIGAALALGKRVILCTPNARLVDEEPHPCAFYFHWGVRHVYAHDPDFLLWCAVAAVRDYTVEQRSA